MKEVQRSLSYFIEHSSPLPTTFAESIAQIKTFALQQFQQEIEQKQLYYHTREHIENVQRRANLILQAIAPYWSDLASGDRPTIDLPRTALLLDLCAISHDMVQLFVPHQPHMTRQREPGASERTTIERLVAYIHKLNQQLQAGDPNSPARLTDDDIWVIQAAIAATICAYDPGEQAIYQPALDETNLCLPIVARILALADIGALSIDGVQVYEREGTLLFLEENLDLIPLLLEGRIDALGAEDPELYESLRQRLLKRCRFQVNFAKSRLARFDREILGLPEQAMSTLTHNVFRYLTPATIAEIVAIAPTAEKTSLEELLEFFKFEQYLETQSFS